MTGGGTPITRKLCLPSPAVSVLMIQRGTGPISGPGGYNNRGQHKMYNETATLSRAVIGCSDFVYDPSMAFEVGLREGREGGSYKNCYDQERDGLLHDAFGNGWLRGRKLFRASLQPVGSAAALGVENYS